MLFFMTEMLSTSEAAKYIQVHEQTFRRLARDGQIPAFKIGGRWKFKKSSLDPWIEKNSLEKSGDTTPYIMVVDDEQNILDALERIFRKEGYRVGLSNNGKDAIEHLKEELPNLVILDLQMPGINGVDVLKKIRMSYDMLPVIVLTGSKDLQLIERALNYSPITLLKKPTDTEKLLSLTKSLLVAL